MTVSWLRRVVNGSKVGALEDLTGIVDDIVLVEDATRLAALLAVGDRFRELLVGTSL
jgi:hypothetical protein